MSPSSFLLTICIVIPVGNSIPISQVREEVAAAYIKDIEWQTSEMLLPYKKLCIQKKVNIYCVSKFDLE